MRELARGRDRSALPGWISSSYRYGLFVLGCLCAVASFGGTALAQDPAAGRDVSPPALTDSDAFTLTCLYVLLATLPALYFSCFAHEVGHALLGGWAGLRVTSFGLGIGRPFMVLRWRDIIIYLAWRGPFQGLTFFILSQFFPRRWQIVCMCLGGILANLSLAVLFLAFWLALSWGSALWLTLAGVNGLAGLVNLVPFTVRVGPSTFRSDGALLLHALRTGFLGGEPANQLAVVRTLGPFWRSIGDYTLLQTQLLFAARTWVDLGDAGQAEALLREADAEPRPPSPWLDALAAWGTAVVARGAGRLTESTHALEEAERGFRALDNEGGLLLVTQARVELLLQRGDAAGAAATVTALMSHPLAHGRPSLQLVLLAARLCCLAAIPGSEEVRRTRAEYEAARRRHAYPLRDLHVYRAVGQWHALREEWGEAERAFQEALVASRSVYSSFTDPDDQRHFLHCQAPLLAATQECLRRLGKDEEATKLQDFFLPPEEVQRRAAALVRERDRRYLRWGLLLTLVNVLVAVGAFAGAVLRAMVIQPGELDGLMSALLSLLLSVVAFTTLTLVMGLARLVLRWIAPTAHSAPGKALFILALCPWLTWLALLPMILLADWLD